MIDKKINIPQRLFRYGSFCEDKQQFLDVAKQINKEQAKWKYTLFDGIIFPSSPLYFNDPYDCDICFDISFLVDDEFKKSALTNIKKFCKPKKFDVNRILSSKDPIKDIEIVLSHHGIKVSMEKITESILDKNRGILKDRLRVVCFSEFNDSILMWSHYASNHKGFCVEYDLTIDELYLNMVKPVEYSDKRAIAGGNVHGNREWLTEIALKKSNVWEYEKEWRLVIPDLFKISNSDLTYKCDDFYINLKNNIKAIYLGAEAPENYISQIIDFYKATEVSLYQMELERDKYNLIPKSLR